jgi:large subunit ribosomal protein L18
MAKQHQKLASRLRRKKHIRKTIVGTSERPRLSVYRSARHIYAQIIDDDTGTTLLAASSLKMGKVAKAVTGGNKAGATVVGKLLGKAAKKKSIETIAFDRNGFRYHGRIAALADALRESGLKF